MAANIFSKQRVRILRSIHDLGGRFNSIKSSLGIPSNELSYHLKSLKSAGLISNEGGSYILTEKAKSMYPYLDYLVEAKTPVMVVTAVLFIKGTKIFLHKKPREPGKGQLIMFGGKADIETDIASSAKISAETQSGFKIKNFKLRCVNEYINQTGNHWVVYFFTATPLGKPLSSVIAADLKNLDSLDLYGDNLFLISHNRNNRIPKITSTRY